MSWSDREEGFTDRLQFKEWAQHHRQICDVLHEIWIEKLQQHEDLADKLKVSRRDILRALKKKGIILTAPTLAKHLTVLERNGELEKVRKGADQLYVVNLFGILRDLGHVPKLLGLEPPWSYEHTAYQKPSESILDSHLYKFHYFPELDSPETILTNYVTDLFTKNGKLIVSKKAINGDPSKISNKALYDAFRGKAMRKLEVIHRSSYYQAYTVNNEKLFHYLKTPEGKKWLVDTLKIRS